MNRTTHRAFALTVLLVVTAVVTTTAVAAEKLFMWQVKSATATVSLVGSIHVGQPDFFPLADPIETAFAAAPILAVEVDMTDPVILAKSGTLMMEKGMLPGDETLQTRLEPEVYARLVAHTEKTGTPLIMFNKFKPGIVALVLVMEEYKRQGFDPELGIDKHFLDAAKTAGKQVQALETLEDQLDLFLSIDDTLDDLMMTEFLDQMVDVKAITAEMIGYWQTGDADGLDRFLQSQMGDGPEMEAFYRRLLDDRNVNMAADVEAFLAGDQDVFVVVGAGHFAGEKGIVSLLRANGLEVEQITN